MLTNLFNTFKPDNNTIYLIVTTPGQWSISEEWWGAVGLSCALWEDIATRAVSKQCTLFMKPSNLCTQ